MNTVGILLAGGASRRFGSPKAFAKWNDRYYYEWAYKALQSVCDEVVIITRQDLINLFPKEMIVTIDSEQFLGAGPLAGIYTGMEKVYADKYVVIPCDMPYLTDKVLSEIARLPLTSDIIAVKQNDVFHPLVSVWKNSLKENLYTELSEHNLSVMQFLSKVKIKWVPAESICENAEQVFQNINKPI